MGFIELTTDKGVKVLVNIDRIEAVSDVSNNYYYGNETKLGSELGRFCLLAGIGNNGGYYVQETYEEIMDTLAGDRNVWQIKNREPDIESNKD